MAATDSLAFTGRVVSFHTSSDGFHADPAAPLLESPAVMLDAQADPRTLCATALAESVRLFNLVRFVACSQSAVELEPGEVADLFLDKAERLESLLRVLSDRLQPTPAAGLTVGSGAA